MRVRFKRYRYLLIFAALCLLLFLAALAFGSGGWLMNEREILDYYRETYGQEMEILSRNVEEFREGDTHTRSQTVVLRPVDLPGLKFQFTQWAGYAYSPGPIPQLFPSFSESINDRYPSDALFYAIGEFVTERGLGTTEETDTDRNLILTAEDWKNAVRQVVEYSNRLQEVSPYDHIEHIFLLTFRRTLDNQQEAAFRANLLLEDGADPEPIIRRLASAGNQVQAAEQFRDEFQAFLAESGLSHRVEIGYNEWLFCPTLTVSIDVSSMTELDAILEQLASFVEARREQAVYTAEGLTRLPVTVHLIQRGVPEPKGQIATWTPFSTGGLSIDPEAIRKHIQDLDLLPDVLSSSDSAAAGMREPGETV